MRDAGTEMAQQIVDACCLINLFASGRQSEVIQAFGGDFYVPQRVCNEALSIRRPDPMDDASLVSEPIDLTDALRKDLIRLCRVEGVEENELFIGFAMELDDGEAACLAVAKMRGWAVATDDKKAIRLANAHSVPVITTPELMHHWAEETQANAGVVAQALRNIESFARFRPGNSASHYRWWTGVVAR